MWQRLHRLCDLCREQLARSAGSLVWVPFKKQFPAQGCMFLIPTPFELLAF